MSANFFLVDAIAFPDETKSNVDQALVEAAQRSGARRKYLARGEGGFYSQISWFPAGYTVPAHRHDHEEMIMVLEGSLTLLGDGPTLGRFDSMVLEAGDEYGFTAGEQGMTFLTVRSAEASIALS
ncbi:MAG TPA: cupin domain-containing protein [Frankiaceae bacterium]|jgi:quercetin dioxygenase-like cupin family protein|nr:cupin domain-containing protein [Frankiaceae bacterium]